MSEPQNSVPTPVPGPPAANEATATQPSSETTEPDPSGQSEGEFVTGDAEVDAVLADLNALDEHASSADKLQALTHAHEQLIARLGAAQA